MKKLLCVFVYTQTVTSVSVMKNTVDARNLKRECKPPKYVFPCDRKLRLQLTLHAPYTHTCISVSTPAVTSTDK